MRKHPFTFVVLLAAALSITYPHTARADDPKNAGVVEYLSGLDQLAAAKWKDAAASFSKAIDQDEENADYYVARGVARALGEDPAKARTDLERALKLHPNYEEARVWLASAVAMQGDFMHDSEIYPFAQFQRPYENTIRSVTHDYGNAVFRRDEDKRNNFTGDLAEIDRIQKSAVAKFPNLAQRFVAHVKENNPSLAGALRDRVRAQYAKGDYANAIRDLGRLLAADPHDLDLISMHAGCALALQAPALARLEYTMILTAHDNDAPAFAGRAQAAALLGDAARARSDIDLACSLSNDEGKNRDAVEKTLKTYAADASSAPLPEMLDKLHESASQSAKFEDLVSQAEALIRAGNRTRLRADETYQTRLRALRLAAAGGSAPALADLGEFLYQNACHVRGELVEPRATLRTFRPQNRQSQTKEIADAEAALDSALAKDPNNLKALTFKAACLIWRVQWADAETLLRKAQTIRSDDPMVLRLFADVLDQAAAIRAGNASNLRSVKSWSDFNWIYYRYPSSAELAEAEKYQEQADRLWDLAMNALESAANAHKGTAEGFFYLGVLERRRENTDAAIQAYQQAIKLDPNNLDAHDELIAVLSEKNQPEAALREQAVADNLVNTTAGPLLRLVWMYIPKTKFKSAREVLDQAAAIDATDARISAYLGALAMDKEDIDGAIAWYRTAAALLEATSRQRGTSSARPEIFASLAPGAIALRTAVELKAADLLETQKRPEEALELYNAIDATEAHVNRDALYAEVPGAMLPDASMDPNMVPPADNFAYMLAKSHCGAAKVLLDAKKYKESLQEAQRARGYELQKPATADPGTHIRDVTALATVIAARASLGLGDRTTAQQTAMQYSSNQNMTKETIEQFNMLKQELGEQPGSSDQTAPPPTRPPPQQRRHKGS